LLERVTFFPLAVTSPAGDTVVFGSAIRIRGRSDRGVAVTINQDTVQVSEQGEFEHDVKLREGRQILTITALDRAGNRSSASVEVVSNTGNELFQLSCPEVIFSNGPRVSITGSVKPSVRMDAYGRPVETRGESFTHALVLDEGPHSIQMKAVSPEGRTQEKTITITIDTRAPEFQAGEIPAFTDRSSVTLEGALSEPAELNIDGLPVPVIQNRFSFRVDLEEGGNTLSIHIRDRAGNVTEKSFTVTRDTEPPIVHSYRLSADRVKGGEIVGVSVKAGDRGVGMARTCACILEINPGGILLSGLLKLNQEADTYEGSVIVPPGGGGSLSLSKAYVSDYLGNTTVIP
jgi:hypothetical protein